LLKDLAKYLKEDILKEYLTDIKNFEEDFPVESKSLTESVHKYGINLRYYGELINLIDKEFKSLSWLKNLIIRDIIMRSASHYFNSAIKDIPDYLIKTFTSHFLNLLLGYHYKLKILELGDIQYSNGRLKVMFQKIKKIINQKSKQ